MKFAIALIFLLPLAGQEKPSETPTIPLEHQRDYYRADGKVQRAQKAVEESQKALVDAQNEMREASMAIMHDCGEYGPSEDPTRKSLICTPKTKQ